jgi:hypothetical protein
MQRFTAILLETKKLNMNQEAQSESRSSAIKIEPFRLREGRALRHGGDYARLQFL